MLRTSVLCCALAGILTLGVGCDSLTKSRDEAVTSMQTDLEKLDKKIAELKEKAEKAAGDEKGRLEAKWKEASRQAGRREEEARRAQDCSGGQVGCDEEGSRYRGW